jgi:16S rRNA (uracil1498-N3)-methyltransferase
MEQFIFREENVSNAADGKTVVLIDGDEHFHLSRVLRVRVGEKILATDGAGKTFLCVVNEIGKNVSVCGVVERYDDLNSARRNFCIAISLLKPMSKVENALEKCTELGAAGFLLFKSERTETPSARLDRLHGIVKSAMKQSLRSHLPALQYVESLEAAAAAGRSYDEKIVLHERSKEMAAGHLIHLSPDRSAVAFIGPEGGFSENEISFLHESGYGDFSLGEARLRSETAAITIASFLTAC